MKKIILTITACSVLFLNACKTTIEEPKGFPFKLAQNSKIKWKGKAADGNFNEGFIDVKGNANAEGFDFDVVDKEIRGGEFTIPVSSIDVTNLPPHLKPVLEEHLKTADFFYMITHPNVTFKITSAKPITPSSVEHNYQVTGQMTLLGQTHPLTFPAAVFISADRLTIKANFTFNQSLWGMNYHIDPSYPANDRLVKGIEVSFDLVANAK